LKSQAKINEEKNTNEDEKRQIVSLKEEINHFQEQLLESEQTIKKMNEIKENLELDNRELSSKLTFLTVRDDSRTKIDEGVNFCLETISRCRTDVQKMILFIRNALKSQFLDPSLLFATAKGNTMWSSPTITTRKIHFKNGLKFTKKFF